MMWTHVIFFGTMVAVVAIFVVLTILDNRSGELSKAEMNDILKNMNDDIERFEKIAEEEKEAFVGFAGCGKTLQHFEKIKDDDTVLIHHNRKVVLTPSPAVYHKIKVGDFLLLRGHSKAIVTDVTYDDISYGVLNRDYKDEDLGESE